MKKIVLKFIFSLILILSAVSITACEYSLENVKISFMVEDSVYATIETEGNTTIAIPNNPTKEGYEFSGWFWDNYTFNNPFTANSLLDTPISSDLKVYAKFIEPHEHSYTFEVVLPTCIDKGYTKYTCSCGHSYNDNTVNSLGFDSHSFTNYISDNNATMEKDGTKTAICNNEGCNATNTIIDEGTKLQKGNIIFNTLKINENNEASITLSNGITSFSFANEITVNGTSTYGVYLDGYCSQEVKTKIAPLSEGNNVFYIYAENTDLGNVLYTISIYRNHSYKVTFKTSSDMIFDEIQVEENTCVQKPTETILLGYDFKNWDFDFNTVITKDTTIIANVEVKEEMKNFEFTSTATNCEITGLKKSGYEINIPNYVTSIGARAFWFCGMKSINISESVTNIDYSAFSLCSDLEIMTVDIKNKIYKSEGNCIIEKATNTVVRGGVKSIIPNTVKTIGKYAFSHLGIEGIHEIINIVIPNGVTVIDEAAFFSCRNINIILPDTIETINDVAFGACKFFIVDIVIPQSVKYIGKEIFGGLAYFENIKYNGTLAEWEGINKHIEWDKNLRFDILCTDGKLLYYQ